MCFIKNITIANSKIWIELGSSTFCLIEQIDSVQPVIKIQLMTLFEECSWPKKLTRLHLIASYHTHHIHSSHHIHLSCQTIL